MQAVPTLSPDQKAVLESVYTFLRGATTHLRAVERVVCPEDEVMLRSLVKLGEMCMKRLGEYFPEVRPLVRGGVR